MRGAFPGVNIKGHLRIQDVKIRRDLKDMGFLYAASLMALVVVGVVFLCVYSRLAVLNLGYEISALNELNADEAEKNKRLRIELTKFKSPERIEAIALKLGLSYPTGKEILYIR